MTENEAKGWAALEATYRECVRIANNVWGESLIAAAGAQQALAGEMRDRIMDPDRWPSMMSAKAYQSPADLSGEIHVPLFTPRDKAQFLKEVSVTLLIEASKRGLSVTEPEDVGPPVKPFGKDKGTPLSAMTGIDIESAVAWAMERPDRSAKFADFIAAAANELAQRDAKAHAIQVQPLSDPPLALATEDRP